MRVVGFISCCESGTEAEDGVGAGAGAFGGALDGFGSAAGLAILGRDAERERGTATGSVDDLRLPRCCISAGAVFGGTGGSTISAALAARLGAGERARRVVLVAGGICFCRREGDARRAWGLGRRSRTMRLRIADAAPPMRAASLFAPPMRAASLFATPARSSLTALNMYDDPTRDPAWQRDSILLLAFCGLEDLARDASTGFKAKLGFDFLQLNAEFSAAVLVAFSWVGVAILTGVLGEHRYDRKRVLITWLLAAPVAFAVRIIVYSGFIVGTPDFAAFDAAATLGLQLFLRNAEEEGYV